MIYIPGDKYFQEYNFCEKKEEKMRKKIKFAI